MTEGTKRLLDVVIAIGGTILTIITIFAGIWQFTRGERNKVTLENELLLRKDEIAFRRQLWLERLTTYRKLAESAGAIIANIDDNKKMQEQVILFTTLYWGIMSFVGDHEVEVAMISFAVEIRDFQNGWSNIDKLKLRANALIQACRDSAEKGKI